MYKTKFKGSDVAIKKFMRYDLSIGDAEKFQREIDTMQLVQSEYIFLSVSIHIDINSNFSH